MRKLRNNQVLEFKNESAFGFTLIELLVALTLFTVVIVMAVGTLLVLIDANTKAQNMQESMTNLTFALDSMTREIRTGRGYYCTTGTFIAPGLSDESTRDCSQGNIISIVEGGSSLTEGSGNNRITYRLAGGSIERRVGTGGWETITSPTTVIDRLVFTVEGSTTWLAASDLVQPTVTIYIEGRAGTLKDVDTGFSMQTTVTRRIRDI